MKKVSNLLFLICFFFILFGVGIISFIEPDRQTSDVENRVLAQRPVISKETILSGQFFSNFEKYFIDQIYGRDYLIKSYTKEQLLQKKAVVNNIVVAKNNWLLFTPNIQPLNKDIDVSERNLRALTDSFKNSNVEFYFAAAPYKMNILMNKYPNYLKNNTGIKNQEYFIAHLPSSIRPINLFKDFKINYSQSEINQMYFKTDHHWNYEGAFAAYQQIINTINQDSKLFKGTPDKTTDLSLKCNNKSRFNGSINVQLYNLINPSGEKICHYIPNFGPKKITVHATDGVGGVFNSFDQTFGVGFNNSNVLYGNIFTWDLAEINYTNPNANNKLHLLILKDSYGNSVQPYLAQHFQKTSVLDLRHYTEKSISQYIKDNNINIVLFLYNDSNLTGEMYNHLTPGS